SKRADFVLYGGGTAKKDAEQVQAQNKWRTPPGRAIKFGSNIAGADTADAPLEMFEELGITGPFIITVGSIDPRKNLDTLYRAYLMALRLSPSDVPQLLIC